jgi:DNA repair protein SbcD/Mre11
LVDIDLHDARTMDEVLERFRTAIEEMLERHDPKPVVARVIFGGETDLHARLAAGPEDLKGEIRSTAIDHFGDRAWIEKVIVRTSAKTRSAADPGPLHELGALVDDLMADEADLMALGTALSSLFQKLPADYRQGEDRLRSDDPQQMRNLVAQAHALLVQRLKKEVAAS